jgi:16S rRNA A1518/A1519 N6-dimethyltransferase RsmA/KsgA/DIM1 with predicted DNA glycosylase/AP lyase activity
MTRVYFVRHAQSDISWKDVRTRFGAGTGKSTIPFAEKGFSIDAVELGEDMAEILKDKCSAYPNVSIDLVKRKVV